MLVKSKIIRYLIVVFCIIAILFALLKVVFFNKKLDTYLVMGDYLSVSGELNGKSIVSFSSLLGKYLLDNKEVEKVNSTYAFSSVDSYTLLEMIIKDAYSGEDSGLVSLIKDSKYISITVGLNDIYQYIRYDYKNKELIYDKEFIKRKIEMMKQNYYEIVNEIKDINSEVTVYLIGYYFPYDSYEEVSGDGVFDMLNDAIKDVGDVLGVYYVDVSKVGKKDNLANENQIYLNNEGHKYIFDVIKSNYFS